MVKACGALNGPCCNPSCRCEMGLRGRIGAARPGSGVVPARSLRRARSRSEGLGDVAQVAGDHGPAHAPFHTELAVVGAASQTVVPAEAGYAPFDPGAPAVAAAPGTRRPPGPLG